MFHKADGLIDWWVYSLCMYMAGFYLVSLSPPLRGMIWQMFTSVYKTIKWHGPTWETSFYPFIMTVTASFCHFFTLQSRAELRQDKLCSIMTKTYLGLRHSGRLAFVFLKFQLCTLLSFLPGHALCFCSFFLEITTKPKRLESLTYWYILYITW